MNFESKAIHAGFDQDPQNGATSIPIYQTAAFAYDQAQDLADVFEGRQAGHIYSRISNPTVSALENRLTALEGGIGTVAVSSGLAAVTTVVQALAEAGDHIVSSKSLFGGTYQVFKQVFAPLSIQTTFVDATDVAAYQQAIQDKTRLVFLETIGNPKLDVPDVKRIADICRERQVPLVVDGTLTTPFLFDAKAAGAAIVLHSATKYMGVSGTTIGGVITDLGNFDWKNSKSEAVVNLAKRAGQLAFVVRAKKDIVTNTGCILAPQSAFLIQSGLETLSLRMTRQCENAMALARYFSGHQAVAAVAYPGLPTHDAHEVANQQFKGRFGGLLTIRLADRATCFKVIDKLKMVKNLANIGDAKTLAIHPASTIYREQDEASREDAGVYDDLIRISLGLEHIDDIVSDFEQALG